MIIVPLVDVHARACTCDGEAFTDADCKELRDLIANDEGAEGEVYVQAVRPPQ
jgi:hypothetical protein